MPRRAHSHGTEPADPDICSRSDDSCSREQDMAHNPARVSGYQGDAARRPTQPIDQTSLGWSREGQCVNLTHHTVVSLDLGPHDGH